MTGFGRILTHLADHDEATTHRLMADEFDHIVAYAKRHGWAHIAADAAADAARHRERAGQ